MSPDLSMLDFGKIKYWQVMDPAPEILQLIDDPILTANVLKAQIMFKKELIQNELKVMNNYFEQVAGMLDKVIAKGQGK